MKKLKRKTRVEPPGNGLDLDLPILADTVLELAYGEETPVADFKTRLRKGGTAYYERVHDAIIEGPEDEPLVQAELDRFFALVDELPTAALKVAESGISPSTLDGVREKFQAALVGTSLLRDPRGLRACLREFEEAAGV